MRKVGVFCLCVVLSCFGSSMSFAQRGLNVPNFTVHTPDITGLGKYGEYPVDFSTGVVPINIPLYTVKSTRLEVPISLSYHSAGIKLDQEASSIGLGWVLNAGGSVIRSIRGKLDEGGDGFLYNYASVPDYNPISGNGMRASTGNSETLRHQMNVDYEPDVFSVSANGLSTDFCLDNNGKYISMDYEPMTFDYVFGEGVITVRDKLGNIYRFGKGLDGLAAREQVSLTYSWMNSANSYPDDTYFGEPTYVGAWYLTEMISADLSDTIFFRYADTRTGEFRNSSATDYMVKDQPLNDQAGTFHSGTIITSVNSSIQGKVLKSILYKNGRVDFTILEDRLDLGPFARGPRVGEMTIYGSKGEQLKRVLFDNNG